MSPRPSVRGSVGSLTDGEEWGHSCRRGGGCRARGPSDRLRTTECQSGPQDNASRSPADPADHDGEHPDDSDDHGAASNEHRRRSASRRDLPTRFALATSPLTTAVPATLVVQVPDDLRSTLAIYTDSEELEVVLAPKGWHCQAGYGADGSGSISAYPTGESTPHAFTEVTIHADSSDEAVTLSETGGSPVIAAATACPYFADAAGQAQQYGVGTCTHPDNSVVDPISPTAVDLALPAGQSASGIPSGGLYVTNAVVLYTPTTQPGTYEGSCTLPQDEHAVCTAVLNDMVSRYSGK